MGIGRLPKYWQSGASNHNVLVSVPDGDWEVAQGKEIGVKKNVVYVSVPDGDWEVAQE